MENEERRAMTLSADCLVWQKRDAVAELLIFYFFCHVRDTYIALTDEENGNNITQIEVEPQLPTFHPDKSIVIRLTV